MKKESILADVCLDLLSAYSICFLIQVTLHFRDVGTESLCSIVLRDDCSAPPTEPNSGGSMSSFHQRGISNTNRHSDLPDEAIMRGREA